MVTLGITKVDPEVVVRSARDVVLLLHDLAQSDREIFAVIHLNPDLWVTHIDRVAAGSMKKVELEAKHVFRNAVWVESTKYLILAHSHPFQRQVVPSKEDLGIARRLVEGSLILGIPIIDSIVVGPEGYYSFVEHGKIFRSSEDYTDVDLAPSGVKTVRKVRLGGTLKWKKWKFR